MFFSIIIPTCNRNNLLERALNALCPRIQNITKEEYEIIVSDDSKENIARDLIIRKYPWVKWVNGPKKGPAANRNNGAKYARGEWLMFIDDDCVPSKNLICAYKSGIANFKNITVFEGYINVDREQRSFLEESPINQKGGYLWSCNFLIKKGLFVNTLKGFDERYVYASMEDVDLRYRLKKLNINIQFIEQARVIHPWRIQRRLLSIAMKRFSSVLYFINKFPERKKDLNESYYLRAFLLFISDLIRNAFRFKFRGFFTRLIFTFLHLYFALYMLLNKLNMNG